MNASRPSTRIGLPWSFERCTREYVGSHEVDHNDTTMKTGRKATKGYRHIEIVEPVKPKLMELTTA